MFPMGPNGDASPNLWTILFPSAPTSTLACIVGEKPEYIGGAFRPIFDGAFYVSAEDSSLFFLSPLLPILEVFPSTLCVFTRPHG